MKPERMKTTGKPLTSELLRKLDAYWRAANYLSVGQIYLYDNPLLKQPLKLETETSETGRKMGLDIGASHDSNIVFKQGSTTRMTEKGVPAIGEFSERRRLHWAGADLERRAKGDPAKARLAHRLREEPTMTWPRLAARAFEISNLKSQISKVRQSVARRR